MHEQRLIRHIPGAKNTVSPSPRTCTRNGTWGHCRMWTGRCCRVFHTYYVTSSYILCHMIILWNVGALPHVDWQVLQGVFTTYIVCRLYLQHTLCIYIIHCVYIVYLQHTLCIHNIHCVFTTYIVYLQHTLCIHNIHCIFTTYIVYLLHTLCVYNIHCMWAGRWCRVFYVYVHIHMYMYMYMYVYVYVYVYVYTNRQTHTHILAGDAGRSRGVA